MPVDVVGIGENSVDLVYRINAPLTPDGKQPIARHQRLAGGQVATTLCTCASLGLNTKYVSAFGSDEDGQFVRGEMARRGVDLSSAPVRSVPNRRALIIVDDAGSRSVLWQRDPALSLGRGELPEGVIAAARVLHVDDTDGDISITAATMARAASRIVTCDIDQMSRTAAALLDAVTHPIVAEHVPAALTGESDIERALRALRRPHHAMVCVTLGSRGAMALVGETIVQAQPPRVDVVDTTGAGDVFRGAFIYALLRGDAPADILTFANAAAAFSCTREGAIDSAPTLADITRLLPS